VLFAAELVLSRIDGDGGQVDVAFLIFDIRVFTRIVKVKYLGKLDIDFWWFDEKLGELSWSNVANGWPVSVRMTPFIAEKGTSRLLGRLIGILSVMLLFIKEKSCDRH
jgi:hypothetical protein